MRRLVKGKLLVDTGDPGEAGRVQELLAEAGYAGLDGATTNPSYFAKNPEVRARIEKGKKFNQRELLEAYRETVVKLAQIIPGGDISVEVYADQETTAEEMIEQAREMNDWIPTARIKLPIIEQGLKAAEVLKKELRLNMTLCFSQQQAAAVYAATAGTKEPVFISPFIGRFDDRGENGAQFVGLVLEMLRGKIGAPDDKREKDGHVKVLAASFRSVENIMEMIRIHVDVMTINLERFNLWAKTGYKKPGPGWRYEFKGREIPKEEVELGRNWREYDINHEMTEVGLKRFVEDWNGLLLASNQ